MRSFQILCLALSAFLVLAKSPCAALPSPPQYPDLSGSWKGGTTSITITQSGSSLTVQMSGRSYTGAFETGSTIRVLFNNSCCAGTLTDNNTKIRWDNNTIWTRSGTPPSPEPKPEPPIPPPPPRTLCHIPTFRAPGWVGIPPSPSRKVAVA